MSGEERQFPISEEHGLIEAAQMVVIVGKCEASGCAGHIQLCLIDGNATMFARCELDAQGAANVGQALMAGARDKGLA